MSVQDIGRHLDEIERILRETPWNPEGRHELQKKKDQFKVIDRSIRQWREKGIPIPPDMNDVRKNLIAEIEKASLPLDDLQTVYNKALNIIMVLARMCRRSPRKDLYVKAKERKKDETGIDILAKILVKVLETMGGSGKERLIFKRVEEDLQGKLTEADMERPSGKTSRLQSNLRRARKKLVKEGILTPESKGRQWTLVDR